VGSWLQARVSYAPYTLSLDLRVSSRYTPIARERRGLFLARSTTKNNSGQQDSSVGLRRLLIIYQLERLPLHRIIGQ
jgi:hypothetical protein